MMSYVVALFHKRFQNGGKDLSGELHYFYIYVCVYVCVYICVCDFFSIEFILRLGDNTGKIIASWFSSSAL